MRTVARSITALMLITLSPRIAAYTVPYETWMGAYVGEKKIGYLSFKIDKTDSDGAPGYRIASVLNNRLMVLGAELNQLVTTVVYTDANYAPLTEDFSMSSGGKTTRVRATFKKDTIECVVSAGSGTSTKTVPIPEGASLVGDAMFALLDPAPEIGKEYHMYYFNPLTLTVDALTVKVEGQEKVTLGKKQYDTIVLKNITPMGDMTVWQEPGGDVVRVNAVMGISMVRQTREEAVSGLDGGSREDFAVLTSVKPNRKIPNPRNIKKLDIVLKGVDDQNMAINDSHQTAAPVEGMHGAVEFRVNAAGFDAAKSAGLPIEDAGVKEYLESTPYIDRDVSEVGKQAREIIGDEKNAYRACSKIRAWVFANMKSRADIGITRAASDVLKSKVGVCRDYGVLFAGLARSIGVPTKIAAGLLYTDNAFYYHVWVECFVGEWVPFDATLATDFVDATHIKLAEGDATAMFGMSKVIGSIKAEVKSYQ